jgi:hypothetical protein
MVNVAQTSSVADLLTLRDASTGNTFNFQHFSDPTFGTSARFNWTGGYLAFRDGTTERMRIDSAGNVGIGTSSPTFKLDTRGSSGALANFQLTTGTNAFVFLQDTVRSYAMFSNNGAWGVYDNTAGTERMRIDSSGNLLVGTTSQNGTAGLTISPNATQGSAQVYFNRASTTNTSFAVLFNNAGTTVGNINYTDTATAYVTSSDYRLKHDIQPMTGALAKVAALKPVTYKWNANDSQSQGFIAHELQEVVPECVTGEKDAVDAEGKPQYQGIDTSFLVATLTAAIQELQAIIESLKTRIEALEGTQP